MSVESLDCFQSGPTLGTAFLPPTPPSTPAKEHSFSSPPSAGNSLIELRCVLANFEEDIRRICEEKDRAHAKEVAALKAAHGSALESITKALEESKAEASATRSALGKTQKLLAVATIKRENAFRQLRKLKSQLHGRNGGPKKISNVRRWEEEEANLASRFGLLAIQDGNREARPGDSTCKRAGLDCRGAGREEGIRIRRLEEALEEARTESMVCLPNAVFRSG